MSQTFVRSLTFDPVQLSVNAIMAGHPTDVIATFRNLSGIILSSYGAWRIDEVYGKDTSDAEDSLMQWNLSARIKP